MIYPCPKPLPRQPEKKEPAPKTAAAKAYDRAMDAWTAEVKARAGTVCEMAGVQHRCWGFLDAHHVIGKGARPRLALDLENGVSLCRGAHDGVHRTRWFKAVFWTWFNTKYPGRRERLMAKAIRERRLA